MKVIAMKSTHFPSRVLAQLAHDNSDLPSHFRLVEDGVSPNDEDELQKTVVLKNG